MIFAAVIHYNNILNNIPGNTEHTGGQYITGHMHVHAKCTDDGQFKDTGSPVEIHVTWAISQRNEKSQNKCLNYIYFKCTLSFEISH